MWLKCKFSLWASAVLLLLGHSKVTTKPTGEFGDIIDLEDLFNFGDEQTWNEKADEDNSGHGRKRDIFDELYDWIFGENYSDYEEAYIVCKNCTIIHEIVNGTAGTTQQQQATNSITTKMTTMAPATSSPNTSINSSNSGNNSGSNNGNNSGNNSSTITTTTTPGSTGTVTTVGTVSDASGK